MKNIKYLYMVLIFFAIIVIKGMAAENNKEYKVLIGMAPDKAVNLKGIKTLVIDAEFFSKEDIAQLHKNGNVNIFSYLNIGSIETFRDDYEAFKDMALGDYENWDEEKWINVADKRWQKRIKDKARLLSQKGIDGFFLDNADVYYHYQRPEIYQGLITLLHEIHKENKPIIINGGDTFISQAMKQNALKGIVTGINQESVFTEINFKDNTFGVKPIEDREYFFAYLDQCKTYGFTVYLLEYGAAKKVEKEIKAYCKKKGFTYYISHSLQLDKLF
ncbi:endo alpha-1,4 polygalactosaminidase [Treponema putidum]|uniref:endo alpha-1,4 polygalactosaminidase n=1 Tax=Treponema putidum TaxID=221027 RepID=UPI0021021DA0|nr:endo alpha-1,4 polygalactosaminidase [Treponema putidum]UTY31077.1 glucanotransferase [Treponema putidum]